MNEIPYLNPTTAFAVRRRWKINRDTDDTFRLDHPRWRSFLRIPSFDEACRLRDMIEAGKVQYVIEQMRSYIGALEMAVEDMNR